MTRKKRLRHEENKQHDILLQPGHDLFDQIKGKRSDLFFQNKNPITLELACGKGEYSSGLAKIYPDQNYIGIDIKGERMWFGAQEAVAHNLKNVGFLRIVIQNIGNFFCENEVEEIWIVHPDPRPKGVDLRRRLTYQRFLDIYKTILVPGGVLRLKTDDQDFFDYSLGSLSRAGRELLDSTHDLYDSELLEEHHGIVTKYEKKFLKKGRKIHYAKRKNPKK